MYQASFISLCNQILAEGCQRLVLPYGVVSHICYDIYEVVAVVSPTKIFQAGDNYDLNDTYCREVITAGKTIAITELEGTRGLQNHPLHQSMAIEAYISTPIFSGEEIWGTLNFSSFDLREHDFNQQDILWLEESAQKISRLIFDNKNQIFQTHQKH